MSRSVIGVCAFALVVSAAAAQGGLATVRDHMPASASGYLAVADVDADGDLDLITTDGGVFLNDGDGLFSAHPLSSPAVSSSSGIVGSPPLIPEGH